MTRLMRAGAALGFVLALLVAVAVRASSDAPNAAPAFDPQSSRFTLAVVPDTQYLFDDDRGDSEPVTAAFEWIVDNRASQNIAFVAGVGDVTQDGLQNQVDRASAAYKLLDDAKIPFAAPTGNHDVNSNTDDTRPATPFSRAFSTERYAKMSTFVSASPGQGYNTAHRFTAGGREWLVLAIDWKISESGVAWAQSVLDANKTTPTIVTSHDMLSSNAAGNASLTGNGQRIWDRVIKANDQVVLALAGHNWPVGRTVRQNDFGHDVHLNLADYQDMYYGGAGIIRTYAFDIDRNTIDVSTFSPWVMRQPEADRSKLERQMLEKTDAQSRFSLSVDFEALAQRLDPKPAPAEVSTDALKLPGTVALWRPSGTGAVTTLEDLSGNGNDLAPVSLNGSTGEQAAVTVSDDHGSTQPSAKSLKFSGIKNQRRGTYLRTAANAALNTNEFKNGYTIEAFFRLPANCCNSNAWMGLIGQDGTGRDLGRTQGDPDESAVVLALSGGAELQWATWPTNRPDNTTAWGHLLPSQAWTHVAVVNDGRYTDLYVDGSLLGRNPLSPAVGLGSTGKSWMLGAGDYGNVVEQTFNGLIGDVRIVDRALAPSRFMNAARTPRIDATATRAELPAGQRAIDVTIEGTTTGTAAVSVVEPHTGERFNLGTQPFAGNATPRFALTAAQYRVLQDGARVEVTLDDAERATLHLRAEGKVPDLPETSVGVEAPVGGAVPATLALTLGAPASFGAFTPGVEEEYTASTSATTVSTAGDAALTVSDPSTTAPGRLVNGTRALTQPLEAKAGEAAYAPLGALLSYADPVSNDQVAVSFRQKIGSTEALRTGTYAKALTFTLSTTTP